MRHVLKPSAATSRHAWILRSRCGRDDGAETGQPLDLSRGDRYLYVLESGAGRIGAFAVGSDGSLSALAGIGGLAANHGMQGIAAY